MNVSIKLDRRSANAAGAHPVRIWIRNSNTTASILTGVHATPQQYDGRDPAHTVRQTMPNARAINDGILKIYAELQRFALELVNDGAHNLTAAEIKQRFESRNAAADEAEAPKTFTAHFDTVAATKNGGKSAETWDYAKKWLTKFQPGEIAFTEIDYRFLTRFDEFMKLGGLSPNTRGIVFRNVRTVFNDGIKNELTENYPFRKFKIPHAQKDKEYLNIDDFRRLLAYKPTSDGRQLAKDLFLLSFYFCGANPIDLFNMKPARNGYATFVRTKTAYKNGSQIKIRVQPEAEHIIKGYVDESAERMLCFYKHYACYDNFRRFVSKKLRTIAKELGIDGLSLYWARYSWATYASRCGVDESVISRALGHAPTSLAGRVYITFDWDRADEANRRVIDYTLGA